MAKVDFYDQKNTKLRIEWMKTRPDKLTVTCKECKRAMLVFDTNNTFSGFNVTANTYGDTTRLSVGRLCRRCIAIKKAKYKHDAKEKMTENTRSIKCDLAKRLEGYTGKVAKSWKCERCDLINSGKNKVCRSCGSDKYRWNGLKVNILKDNRSMLKLGVAK